MGNGPTRFSCRGPFGRRIDRGSCWHDRMHAANDRASLGCGHGAGQPSAGPMPIATSAYFARPGDPHSGRPAPVSAIGLSRGAGTDWRYSTRAQLWAWWRRHHAELGQREAGTRSRCPRACGSGCGVGIGCDRADDSTHAPGPGARCDNLYEGNGVRRMSMAIRASCPSVLPTSMSLPANSPTSGSR
jgi:hypothetical protein